MAEMADWVDRVSQNIYDCPRTTIIGAVRESAVEFCTRSLVWIELIDPMTFDSSNDTYLLNLPYASQIVKVWTMRGMENIRDQRLYREPQYLIQNSDVLVFTQPDRESFDNDLIQPVISLRPTQTAQTCPDVLFNRYFDAIASGAIAKLLMQPSAAWANRNDLAAVHFSAFERGISQAADDLNNGFGRIKPLNEVMPHFI